MKKLTILIFALVLHLNAFAHEGHGNEGVTDAPHGGTIKEGKKINLEFVSKDSEVLLYPFTKDGKALMASDLKLSATTQMPKKTKSKIEFKPEGDHFTATMSSSGSYRYELQVDVTYMNAKESLKFQVEPQG